MTEFIKQLQALTLREAREIHRRETAEEVDQQAREREVLDDQYRQDQARQAAIRERTITLDMAWTAASLLETNGIHPEYWMRTDPVYEPRGLRRREKLVGERESIVVEGWPVLSWQYGRYQPFPIYNLILAPNDSRHTDTNLAYFEQYPGSMYAWHRPLEPVHPDNVHPIGKEPLSATDMPWTTDWSNPQDGVGHRWSPDDPLIADRRGNLDPENAFADYAKYKKARIEQRIRKAIAGVLAQHLVVPELRASDAAKRLALTQRSETEEQ